jgi:hypothetical protein
MTAVAGSLTTATAIAAPATANGGSGHHHGADVNPSPDHRWIYTPSWMAWTSSRNPQQATATTTPRKALATNSTRYRLLRSSSLTVVGRHLFRRR